MQSRNDESFVKLQFEGLTIVGGCRPYPPLILLSVGRRCQRTGPLFAAFGPDFNSVEGGIGVLGALAPRLETPVYVWPRWDRATA